MLKQHESELLSAYADNELNGEELAQVRENLTNFSEWREELESLQKTKNLTMTLPHLAAPADLLDFIEGQAHQYEEKKKFSFWQLLSFFGPLNAWSMGTPLAAAAVFVMMVGVRQVHQNGFIPLEPLLAAHSRSHAHSLFQQNVMEASLYSQQLKNHGQI